MLGETGEEPPGAENAGGRREDLYSGSYLWGVSGAVGVRVDIKRCDSDHGTRT